MTEATKPRIAALGTHCYAAWLLKRYGYRDVSGPFDWIFSDAGIVRACLEDDFRALLDTAQYEESGPPGHVGHRTLLPGSYRESLWVHADPRREADRARLEAQVAAFRAFLAMPEPVLAMVSEAHIFEQAAFDGIAARLARINADARVIGLVIEGQGPVRSARPVPTRGNASLRMVRLTTGYGPEIGFADPEDDRFLVEQIEDFLMVRT